MLNNNVKVAVASRSFSRNPTLRAELLARYPNTRFNDAGVSLKGAALIDFLQGHSKAIIALEIVDESLIRALPELKRISKYGVGLDKVDQAVLADYGVTLRHTPGVNKRSVAEMVIASAISLLRYTPQARDEVRQGVWQQRIGRELTGKTIGIIGCGHVGKELVRLLQPFQCQVLAHDVLAFPDFYAEYGVRAVSKPVLLQSSDVVSLHVPLDTTTQNFIDADALQQMRSDAILINYARGGIVCENALKQALQTQQIQAAALDVFASEPPEDKALLQLPNLFATPHLGGSSVEAVLAMGRAAIEGLG